LELVGYLRKLLTQLCKFMSNWLPTKKEERNKRWIINNIRKQKAKRKRALKTSQSGVYIKYY